MSELKKKKQMFSWMNPKLEIRLVSKFGKNERGTFAKKGINKGELLTAFGDYVITAEEEMKLPEEFRDHGVQISEDIVLTIKKKSEIGDGYFNHSCNPNAGYKGQIFLVAMRDIKKNEEITFDYAMVLHKSKKRKLYEMKCLCGSKNCRKLISILFKKHGKRFSRKGSRGLVPLQGVLKGGGAAPFFLLLP